MREEWFFFLSLPVWTLTPARDCWILKSFLTQCLWGRGPSLVKGDIYNVENADRNLGCISRRLTCQSYLKTKQPQNALVGVGWAFLTARCDSDRCRLEFWPQFGGGRRVEQRTYSPGISCLCNWEELRFLSPYSPLWKVSLLLQLTSFIVLFLFML